MISAKDPLGYYRDLDPDLVPCTECGIGTMSVYTDWGRVEGKYSPTRGLVKCLDCGFIYYGPTDLEANEAAAAYAEWAIGRRKVLRRERADEG